MEYKVYITSDAEEDLDRFIRYLLFDKNNKQAASNLLNDFEATKQSLSLVAGSLKLCDNPALNKLGYRRINFLTHNFFMLYRIEENTAIVDNIFHELQDYENKLISSFCLTDYSLSSLKYILCFILSAYCSHFQTCRIMSQ